MIRTRRSAAASLLCALAAGGAVLATATPSQAAAAPAAAVKSITHECFPYYVWRFTGNGVRIHQHPATGSAGGVVYGLGYSGQEFTARSWNTATGSGYSWFYGTDQSTGVTGWVATAYLSYVGDEGTCLN